MTPPDVYTGTIIHDAQKNSEIQERITKQCDSIEKILSASPETQEAVENSYLEARIIELMHLPPSPDTISVVNNGAEGFIHSTSEIKSVFVLDGFRLDDDTIYKQLIDVLKEMRSAGWEGRSIREMLGIAVMTTVDRYFGITIGNDHTHNARQSFYTERTDATSSAFSVKELKGKALAECVEKSAVANNLFAFMGFDTRFVISSKTKLEEESDDFHAYLYINSGKTKAIVEITNPILVYKNSGKEIELYPSIYPLSPDQAEKFEKKFPIVVIHCDYNQDENGNSVPIKSSRTYCLE